MKNKIYLTIFFCTNLQLSFAQHAHQYLREADASYQRGDFKTSEEKYKKADEIQPAERTRYNLGNAMYRQKRLEEATQQYESVIKQPNATAQARAKALHNLGNIQFEKKDYAKAIESYRNALKINPKDVATKRNLAIAQKYLPPPPPQKQQQNQHENKEKQQKQQQKQHENKEKQQKQPGNEGQNQQQNNQDNHQSPQPQQQQMSHDDLRQMLQIMEDEEKKVQQRLQKGKPKPNRSAKDW